MRLVTIGETMAVLTAAGPLRHSRSLGLGVAGAEANVAIGAARLGLPSAWVGRIGDDEFGALVKMTLAGQEVDTRSVLVDPAAPTGLMIKEHRTSAVTRVSYRRAGSAGSRLGPADVPPLDRATILHVTGITPALSGSARDTVRAAVDHARAVGATVSVDINHRSTLWTRPEDAIAEYRWLASRADVLFATEAEAQLLTGTRGAADLARLGPAQVLLKRGAEGAVALIDGQHYKAPVFPVTACDPVGAGDAFAAAYCAELARGAAPAERLRTAAAAGAFAVTVPGDWEGFPARSELALLKPGDDVHR